MTFLSHIATLLLSLALLAEPVLVDHIVAICDYYVIGESDIARTKIIIDAGVPTILERDELTAAGQDGKNAILKELLMRHLAYKRATRFQMGKDEAEALAAQTLDEMKAELGKAKLNKLLRSARMDESELTEELKMWLRAKIFISRQIDMSVELGKRRFYERNRKLFPKEFYEEEERVAKVYRKRLLDKWLKDEIKKTNFRILDKAFSEF